MGAGMHSLVSCCTVNDSNRAVVDVFIQMLCARNMKMLWANRGGVGNIRESNAVNLKPGTCSVSADRRRFGWPCSSKT